jgi:Na+/H+ antiporter NhaD/arsenite permease-like protein
LAGCAAISLIGGGAPVWGAEGSHPAEHPVPSVLWALPFAAMLLAIAVFPLLPRMHHWWEQNRSKFLVGVVLGAVILGHYLTRSYGFHGAGPGVESVLSVLDHAILRDYIPFIVLLFSLYVVAGGMRLTGDLQAKPSINTAFLALGALLASFIGTTGASMLLIRPLLQTNQERKRVQHTVIFFIFLVSNIGGCLLPVGDPPLFLGYLQGVPFLWTMTLIGPWAFCVTVLLAVYFIWDHVVYRRETAGALLQDKLHREPLRIRGMINILWLVGVVLSVALIVPGKPLPGTSIIARDFLREAVMLTLSAISLATTPRGLRKAAEFSYGPILEVACLFLGIFITMQVPLEILNARGSRLGLDRPFEFFWATGLLSSLLDNAPTYLVFLETAKTLPAGSLETLKLVTGSVRVDLLTAISLGAVFMGANTYIGNGPNFMVKAIAEARGIKMPGFFGYMIYSGLVLIPLFIAVTFLFFS